MFDRNMAQSEWNILDIGQIFSNKGQTYLDRIRQDLKDFKPHQDNLKHLFHSTQNIDDLLIDYLKLFVFIYEGFSVPIRFNFLNANELNSNEALRVKIEALLPSEQKYLAVGEVSLLNDYISERLQIRLDDKAKSAPKKGKEVSEKGIKHISMIHATVMDVSAFMQVLIESNTSVDVAKGGKHSFKLPDQLKKYYLK